MFKPRYFIEFDFDFDYLKLSVYTIHIIIHYTSSLYDVSNWEFEFLILFVLRSM